MSARKAKVKGARLFKDTYAVAVLGREGHHVIGNVLTCELSDTTRIGYGCWKDIKESAMEPEGLKGKKIGDYSMGEEIARFVKEHVEA